MNFIIIGIELYVGFVIAPYAFVVANWLADMAGEGLGWSVTKMLNIIDGLWVFQQDVSRAWRKGTLPAALLFGLKQAIRR